MHNQKFNIEPGMVISHFRLEKLLGEGGMGVVYLAEDITLNRKVAIKFMHKSMLASLPTKELREQVEQRFIREAKSVAGISHTNIAQVYEANFSDDNWYIVMEFINGRPLDDIIKEDGAFSEKDALRILDQTSKGLKYAWDNCKVVHRDIKPQNLMLTFDNYVKIVDLGLAKPVLEYEDDGLDLTGVGIPVGTPFYMSPEQAVAGKVDYRADMFALGATVYELVTGSKTYKGKTQAMIYGKKINQEYTRLHELGVDPNLAELIDRLLEPSVANRYETWDELIYDVRQVRKGKPISGSKTLPENFDPMEETIDEDSVFLNEPIPDIDPMAATIDEAKPSADPMADTLDENTPYDQSRVKSSTDNSEADPMLATLDENTLYDQSRVKSSTDNSEVDPMLATLDENTLYDQSRVKSSADNSEADPMADTLDENTPYDQSRILPPNNNSDLESLANTIDGTTPYDQSRVKSSVENSKVNSQPVNINERTQYDQSRVNSTPDNSKSKIIEIEDSTVNKSALEKSSPSENLDAPSQENKPAEVKSVKPLLYAIFAITAIAVALILAFKKPTVTESPEWPKENWNSFIADYKWLSTYDQKSISELRSITNSDKNLDQLIKLTEDANIAWLNKLLKNNETNTAFINNPSKFEPSLTELSSVQKINDAVKSKDKLKSIFPKLRLNNSLQKVKQTLKNLKVTPAEISLSSTPSSQELILTYKKLKNAELWISRIKENNSILERLAKTDSAKSPVIEKLSTDYNNFKNKLKPFSALLNTDTFNALLIDQEKKIKDSTSSIPTVPKEIPKVIPKEVPSVLKAPLKEIENMLSDLEKNYSDQLYAKIDQKFLFVKEMLAQASKEDLALLNSLKEKHLLFKRTDIQLTIKVDHPTIKAESRNWPEMSIEPNLNCYYALIYYVNQNDVKIADPVSLEDKIIFAKSANKTKKFRALKGLKVKVLCFTYLNDYRKLYALDKKENHKLFLNQELESFIKSINPKHIAHKLITLQKPAK